MHADQRTIDAIVQIYNEVTRAHKRAPVERYVQRQLAAGETVDLPSGHPRWTCALRLSGTPDDLHAAFVINPAVPASFLPHLHRMQRAFEERLSSL